MLKFKDLSREELLKRLREIDKSSNIPEDVREFQIRELSQLAQLGKFASLVLHEVSNSLTISMLSTSLLKTKLEANLDPSEEVKKIENSQNKMKKILESVSRNVHISNHYEEIHINQFISDELTFINEILNKRKVSLTQNLNAQNDKVDIIPSQFAQVISNIIFNACDAIEEAGRDFGEREIDVQTYNKDQFCTIEIKDNGIGIEKDNLKKIFDPFYTTKKRGQGTGFGLSVASQILNDFNGCIEVDSELNNGSVFKIKIPLV